MAVDAEIEVIGAVSDGQKGLEKIDQLHPDLVTLDVEMPGMSGLETARAKFASVTRACR